MNMPACDFIIFTMLPDCFHCLLQMQLRQETVQLEKPDTDCSKSDDVLRSLPDMNVPSEMLLVLSTDGGFLILII